MKRRLRLAVLGALVALPFVLLGIALRGLGWFMPFTSALLAEIVVVSLLAWPLLAVRLMPQNGELLWTARPFRRFTSFSPSTGYPSVIPRWMWTVLWIWKLEGRFWCWWYEASGQKSAYALGHKHGMAAGAHVARHEILRGFDALVEDAKR